MTQEVKSCSVCKKELPLSHYHKTGGGRLRSDCKDCRSVRCMHEWAKQGAYREYKRKAPERGYTFEIEKEDFDRLVRLPCYYCGYQSEEGFILGLDRIKNNKSYTINNVVPCCSQCNYMKGTLDDSEFIQQARKIAEKHTYRKSTIPIVQRVWGRKVYSSYTKGEIKDNNFKEPIW